MKFNWKAWAQGLGAAVLSAAGTAAMQAVGNNNKINKGTGLVALVGGGMGALLYLAQSPLRPAALPAAPPVASVSPSPKASV